MQTSSISAAHGKGRHTTSHRELVHIPARRLLVIDTPGLRELGLWGEGDGVDVTFADIVALAHGCRFSDCAHDHEPSCAVKDAVARGELDPRRLESWRRLSTERESTARRANEHERRRYERGFAKQVRETSGDAETDVDGARHHGSRTRDGELVGLVRCRARWRLAACGGIHRGVSRRNFRRGREARTPLWWPHC